MYLRILLLAVGWAAGGWTLAAPQYTGSAACQKCHTDVVRDFPRNPHYKGVAAGKPDDQAGCESCHGPGSEHLAKPAKTNIRAFSQLDAKPFADACLACHANTIDRAQIRRSSHTLAQVACGSCHSVHKAASPQRLLARAQQKDLCFTCHANVRAQFSLPFKHRVNEGFMTCSDCHNPHGAPAPAWRMGARPRMVDAKLGNEEPCLKCHTDKRGPFAYEHAAVRVDGCEACHQPHGSMNARMLKRPAVVTLCQECHTGGGDFGRQGDGIKLTPLNHNIADPRYRNCTTCHVRIHGSNADARFRR